MNGKTAYYLRYGIALATCALAGCSRAPTFNVVGSLFPAWLVCLVIGILLTLLSHWLLLRLNIALAFAVLAYPSLTALFTFLVWLIFFS